MRTRADIKLLLNLCMVWPGIKVNGQNVAVKTNLLYDIAAYTANAGVEVGLAPRWTWTCPPTTTVGHSPMTANGSIGCYSLRRVIGSATVLPDISSGFMLWEANTMQAA